jgi:NAD(P)-dependent dehydrogenase (short-subunit alcohol dehydrogenase family)
MTADRVKGKVVLVTGGNSGMGLAAAQAFARDGAEVIISGRNQETIDAAVAGIGARVTGSRADVSRLEDITRLMGSIKQRNGRLDVLFANAGLARFAPIAAMTEAVWGEVRSLGRSLGGELVGAGIRVNVVSPGPIETPLFGSLGMASQAVAEMKQQWAGYNPMQRFGAADEVARAVLFLASAEASYITGVDLPVDGGLDSF